MDGLIERLNATGKWWMIGKGKVTAKEPLYACLIQEACIDGRVIVRIEGDDLGECVERALTKVDATQPDAVVAFNGKHVDALRGLATTRKADTWNGCNDVDSLGWRALAAVHDQIPRFRLKDLYPHGSWGCPMNDFMDSWQPGAAPFNRGETDERPCVFILEIDDPGMDADDCGTFLVNTEGYSYCRYIARIS